MEQINGGLGDDEQHLYRDCIYKCEPVYVIMCYNTLFELYLYSYIKFPLS